jgi:RNA polymerase sigma-70 factor, ECF subfamily
VRTLRRDDRTRPGGAVNSPERMHMAVIMNGSTMNDGTMSDGTLNDGNDATASSRHYELELMREVARGVGAAQRMLATRFVLRVRRASHALMGGSPYADDAAQLTLVELLRSAPMYRADVDLDRWVDRIIARSVVRFARAVRRRHPSLDSNHAAATNASDGPVPRTLDEFLNRLPVAAREVLVLKHALGHSVEEIAEITQASPSTVRERLLSSRRDLRKLIRRDHEVSAQPGGTT